MCSIFLIKSQSCVCSKVPAEASYRKQSLTAGHYTVYAALWTEKVNI